MLFKNTAQNLKPDTFQGETPRVEILCVTEGKAETWMKWSMVWWEGKAAGAGTDEPWEMGNSDSRPLKAPTG